MSDSTNISRTSFVSTPQGYKEEHARQDEMRPIVEKVAHQYLRGLITAEELASEVLEITSTH